MVIVSFFDVAFFDPVFFDTKNQHYVEFTESVSTSDSFSRKLGLKRTFIEKGEDGFFDPVFFDRNFFDVDDDTILVSDSFSAEYAAAVEYAFKPVAEFALTTTGVWIAHIQNATSSQHYKSGFATGATKYKTNTYSNGLPNPVGGGFTNETYKFVQKVGHS